MTPSRVPGHALFFPAASLYAIVALDASVLGMLGVVPALPGLSFPAGHAHELLFGFALATVAGNQLGPTPALRLALLFGTWLAARAAFLAAPQSLASAIANGVFVALLAGQLAPRLLGSAKKLRNRALPITLVALCATAIAAQVSIQSGRGGIERVILTLAILVLTLLMLFMGGRIIAPAAAGQLYRQGGNMGARVQPRIEGALIVTMFAAIAATALDERIVAAFALIAACVLAALRMMRWELWRVRGRPDLICLAAGYAWLVAGLAATAAAILSGSHEVTALHTITVGAMGTLTVNVMALTWLRLARRDPALDFVPPWGTLLVALAAIARIAADFDLGDRRVWLAAAALLWSGAYALLLWLFARVRRPVTRSPET